jgi:peroxiredoxin
MIDARSTTHGRLVLAAVFLACGLALPLGAAAAPDYTLIPKLQEIKDHPAAPDFTLPDASGKNRSLKDYRGKVVFLAFWATWCPFCREEIPAMESVYKDYKGKGLEIVAVSIKDKREDTLAFVKKNKLTYPILMDPEGDIGSLYGAYATPTVYLIDRNGQVLARMWGPAGWGSPASRKLIAQLVEQK